MEALVEQNMTQGLHRLSLSFGYHKFVVQRYS